MHNIPSPFPRSIKGKFHIVFAHLRQLHLTTFLTSSLAPEHDVYFVDQLSTCVPFLRLFTHKRVLFYCHFPDKLLANGAYVEGKTKNRGSLLKLAYRYPMDLWEEFSTGACYLDNLEHASDAYDRLCRHHPGELKVHGWCLQETLLQIDCRAERRVSRCQPGRVRTSRRRRGV